MQTFSMALSTSSSPDYVDRETAADAATNRHDFEIALDRAEKAARVALEETTPPPLGTAGTGPDDRPGAPPGWRPERRRRAR